MKIGAKTNLDDIEAVKTLAKEADYIEVYYTENVNVKKIPRIEYTMHCPHHDFNVNLGLLGAKSGISFVKDSLELAEKLKCMTAVVHTGTNVPGASVENMITNLKELTKFAKDRGIKLLIENLPYVTKKTNHLISLPEEHKKVMDAVKCGFCLDFSHAAHSAFSHKINYKTLTVEFLKLRPSYFHLYNTNVNEEQDIHFAFDATVGNLDIDFALSVISRDSMVTLELPEPKVKNFLNAKKLLKSKGVI